MSIQCYSCANYKGGICSITGGNPFTENPCRCYSPKYEIITHKQNNEPSYEELQAENEQLKVDLEHARSYKHTIKMRNRNLQAENERLKAENATLKCLALHVMSEYFGYKMWFSNKKKLRARYGQFANKFYFAYRKAKMELREGK